MAQQLYDLRPDGPRRLRLRQCETGRAGSPSGGRQSAPFTRRGCHWEGEAPAEPSLSLRIHRQRRRNTAFGFPRQKHPQRTEPVCSLTTACVIRRRLCHARWLVIRAKAVCGTSRDALGTGVVFVLLTVAVEDSETGHTATPSVVQLCHALLCMLARHSREGRKFRDARLCHSAAEVVSDKTQQQRVVTNHCIHALGE